MDKKKIPKVAVTKVKNLSYKMNFSEYDQNQVEQYYKNNIRFDDLLSEDEFFTEPLYDQDTRREGL